MPDVYIPYNIQHSKEFKLNAHLLLLMAVYVFSRSRISQLVTLLLDSKPTSVLCHFGDFNCGDGGWTPVMKINGNKVKQLSFKFQILLSECFVGDIIAIYFFPSQSTFHYNSNYWSDKTEYNLPGGETGFDTQETKLPSYWNTSFTKICLGMKIGQQINFIVINKQANSLYSLITDGQYRNTSLGRNTWKTLIGSQASLQLNCNKEGFNVLDKARIGILGNNEDDCITCDSRIGFGTISA